MSYTSVFSKKAQKEMDASWEWYEERKRGLGDLFIEEVIKVVQIIESDLAQFPLKFKSYHETLIDTFPMLIIYKVNRRKKLVKIHSVFHTSRNPAGKYGQ